MIASFLALATVLGIAACWFYWKWSDEQWKRAEENRLLRKQKDSVEQRADDLEQRLDQRILEVGTLNDELAAVNRALKAEKANRRVAEDEARRTCEDLQAMRESAEYWKSTAERFEQQYEKANADAIAARETVADWIAQRTFGRSIFHKAPALPAESMHRKPIPRQRIQGRLAVRLAEQQFAKAEREYLARQNGLSAPESESQPVHQ